MRKVNILRYAIINSFFTTLYIICISTFLFLGGEGFIGKENSIFIPIVMLMLLVFSAALCGSLIFGRPILYYIDNKKREAVLLLIYTLTIFFILTVIMVSTVIIFT